MRAILARMKFVTEHPALNLAAGLILLGFSLWEIVGTLVSDLATLKFGAHHGVALFGALQILKSIPDLLAGMEYTARLDL